MEKLEKLCKWVFKELCASPYTSHNEKSQDSYNDFNLKSYFIIFLRAYQILSTWKLSLKENFETMRNKMFALIIHDICVLLDDKKLFILEHLLLK